MDIGSINAYTDYMKTQNTSAAKLSENLENKDYNNASEDDLLKACKEFEAYFLEQVFKSMEKTVDVFKDKDAVSNYSNSMLDFFEDETMQTLAKTSTETQGLGLAQSLYEQMKRNYGLS